MIASEATKTLLLPPSTYLSFSRSLPTFPVTLYETPDTSDFGFEPYTSREFLTFTDHYRTYRHFLESSVKSFFQLEIHFHSHAYHHSRYCVYSSVIVTPQVYGFLFLPQSIDTPCTATPVTPLCISLCHSFIPS